MVLSDIELVIKIIFDSQIWIYFGFDDKSTNKALYSRMEELFKEKG